MLLAPLLAASGCAGELSLPFSRDGGPPRADLWSQPRADRGPGLSDTLRSDLPGAPDAAPPPPPACYATLCFAGAVTRHDSVNPEVAQICATMPGLVKACDKGQCFALFEMLQSGQALEALISHLDQNQDGRVDEQDPQCQVRLVGYSWGGVNAVDLAKTFLGDPRVAPSRRVVHTVIAIDPYVPLKQVDVVAGVQRFWEYRHSYSPPNDCSSKAPLGPYKGIVPRCHKSVAICLDYDFSLAPTTFFGGYPGNAVGHCTVVRAARAAIEHNLHHGTSYHAVPPTVPVARY